MSSIDERIVEMKFNNGQFQKGIDQTAESLDKLKQSLNLEGAGTALEKIASKFNWLSVAGATGLVSLTNAAISAGKSIYDATVGQIITGGEKRSQNFAQAKFQLEGLKVTGKDLKTVMDAASYAVDGTAYGLDQAAVAASSFVASKVPLEQLPSALRAISGVAAMTNRDFGDISQIFTTVAGNGRLMASELNRIGQSGLNAAAALSDYLGVSEEEVRKMTSEGKINFETFAAAMDSAFGEQATKANLLYSGALANVRSALSRIGELPADGKFEKMRLIFVALIPVINSFKKAIVPVLETVRDLQIKSGETIAKFISGIDFSGLTSFFKNIAWAMRDLSGIFSSFGKVVGDIWREVFPKKETEYGVSIITKIGRAISKFTQSLQPSAQTLATFGAALKIVFTALKMVWEGLKLVGEVAWVIIQIIFELAATVWSLIRPLDLTGNVAADSMDSFSSFLEMLIAFREKAIRPLINWLKDLRDGIQGLSNGTGSGIPWLDTVYNSLIKLREFLGESVPKWFEAAKKTILDFFDTLNLGDKFKGITDYFGNIDWTVTMETAGTKVGNAWSWVLDIFKYIVEALKPVMSGVKDFGTAVGDAFKDMFSSVSKSDWLGIINTVGLAGGLTAIILMIKDLRGLKKAIVGMADSVTTAFTSMGDYFTSLKDAIKYDNFVKMGVGILLIAGAIWILSDAFIKFASVDPDKVAQGMVTMAISLTLLVGAVYFLSQMMGDKAFISGTIGMLLMAGALLVLYYVVEKFGTLKPDEISQGMLAMGLSLALLVGSMYFLSSMMGDKSVIAATVGMTLLAGAIYMLAGAVAIFGAMDTGMLLQGGAAVAGIIVMFTVMAKNLEKSGGSFLKAAIGIGIISLALYALAGAMAVFAAMPKEELIKGGATVVVILGVLTLIAEHLDKSKGGLIQGGVGILLIAIAMVVLAHAMTMLSALSWEQLAVGLVGVVLGMGALVAIAQEAQKAVAGAVGMILIAGAMVVLAYAVQMLSAIPMETVVVALGALVVAMLGLAVAAAIMDVFKVGALILVGVILAIGAAALAIAVSIAIIVGAIALFGPAATIASAGLEVFAKTMDATLKYIGSVFAWAAALVVFGIAALVAGIGALALGLGLIVLGAGFALILLFGPAGALALQNVAEQLSTLVDKVPDMIAVGAALIVLGVGALLLGVGLLAAGIGILSFVQALLLLNILAGSQGITAFLTGLMDLIPLLAQKIGEGIIAIAVVIGESGPQLVMAFQALLLSIITAATNVIPEFINMIKTVILTLLVALQEILPQLIETVVAILLALIEGLKVIIPALIDLGVTIVMAFVEALVLMVPYLADAGLRLLTGVLDAIAANIGNVITSGTNVVIAFIQGIGDNAERVVNAGLDTIIKFMNGVANGIRDRKEEMRSAGANILDALTGGMSSRVGAAVQEAQNFAARIANAIPTGIKKLLGINSPSKVMQDLMGWVVVGITNRLDQGTKAVNKSAQGLGSSAVDGVRSTMSAMVSALNTSIDLDPTIRPVMDLSDVKSKAATISTLFDGQSLNVTGTYNSAASIVAERRKTNEEDLAAQSEESTLNGSSWTFIQNNNSPKALSRAEIYRKTKNQISTAEKRIKGELENAR